MNINNRTAANRPAFGYKNKLMEFKNEKLKLVKDAIEYAIANCRSESKDAEFAFLYADVVVAIEKETKQDAYVKTLESLPGCVFKFCGQNPKCEGKCVYPQR
ncbi:MAG: hypothetical protein EOO51_12660 [Flavobacterium sp.]|nr:MAG: hypothetical protein EOO51_12660 [Flavobacterium sp.]